MFRCESCGRVTEPREPAAKKVIETRAVEYRNDGKVTIGTEIVKEITVCIDCR